MKYFLFTLTIALHVLLAPAQQKKPVIYYPQPGNWEHRSAALVGMDSTLLQEAIAYAQAHESKEPRDLKCFSKAQHHELHVLVHECKFIFQ